MFHYMIAYTADVTLPGVRHKEDKISVVSGGSNRIIPDPDINPDMIRGRVTRAGAVIKNAFQRQM